MARLWNKTTNLLLIENLHEAKSFWPRMRGLLGKSILNKNEGLWIHRCNSIHTFGMKFTIDCLFLDKKMQVCAIKEHVKPWKIVLPIWQASSVIELSEGKLQELHLQVGDQVYVGH